METKKNLPGHSAAAAAATEPHTAPAAQPVLDPGLLAWLAQFETLDRLHAYQDSDRWILRDGLAHRC